MKRLWDWVLRKLDLVRGGEYRAEVWRLGRLVATAEEQARQAEKARKIAVTTEEAAKKQLRDLRDKTGVALKFGGSVDIDYDQLIRALGKEQATELRGCIDDFVKGSNAPLKRRAR